MVPKQLDLEKTGPWIMIIDNADDDSIIFPPPKGALDEDEQRNYLACCLPQNTGGRGRIIITTRYAQVCEDIMIDTGSPIPVPELSESNARLLLKSKIPEEKSEEEAASMLLKELEYIPWQSPKLPLFQSTYSF